MKRLLLSSLIAAALLPAAATAQVGNVSAITGETGTVIVQRGTETFSLGADNQIFPGDKITTRTGGTVDLTAYGCTVSIPSEATLVIAATPEEFCTRAPITLADSTTPAVTTTTTTATIGGVPVGTAVVGGVIVGGVIIAAASGGDDDDDTPASP